MLQHNTFVLPNLANILDGTPELSSKPSEVWPASLAANQFLKRGVLLVEMPDDLARNVENYFKNFDDIQLFDLSYLLPRLQYDYEQGKISSNFLWSVIHGWHKKLINRWLSMLFAGHSILDDIEILKQSSSIDSTIRQSLINLHTIFSYLYEQEYSKAENLLKEIAKTQKQGFAHHELLLACYYAQGNEVSAHDLLENVMKPLDQTYMIFDGFIEKTRLLGAGYIDPTPTHHQALLQQYAAELLQLSHHPLQTTDKKTLEIATQAAAAVKRGSFFIAIQFLLGQHPASPPGYPTSPEQKKFVFLAIARMKWYATLLEHKYLHYFFGSLQKLVDQTGLYADEPWMLITRAAEHLLKHQKEEAHQIIQKIPDYFLKECDDAQLIFWMLENHPEPDQLNALIEKYPHHPLYNRYASPSIYNGPLWQNPTSTLFLKIVLFLTFIAALAAHGIHFFNLFRGPKNHTSKTLLPEKYFIFAFEIFGCVQEKEYSDPIYTIQITLEPKHYEIARKYLSYKLDANGLLLPLTTLEQQDFEQAVKNALKIAAEKQIKEAASKTISTKIVKHTFQFSFKTKKNITPTLSFEEIEAVFKEEFKEKIQFFKTRRNRETFSPQHPSGDHPSPDKKNIETTKTLQKEDVAEEILRSAFEVCQSDLQWLEDQFRSLGPEHLNKTSPFLLQIMDKQEHIKEILTRKRLKKNLPALEKIKIETQHSIFALRRQLEAVTTPQESVPVSPATMPSKPPKKKLVSLPTKTSPAKDAVSFPCAPKKWHHHLNAVIKIINGVDLGNHHDDKQTLQQMALLFNYFRLFELMRQSVTPEHAGFLNVLRNGLMHNKLWPDLNTLIKSVSFISPELLDHFYNAGSHIIGTGFFDDETRQALMEMPLGQFYQQNIEKLAIDDVALKRDLLMEGMKAALHSLIVIQRLETKHATSSQGVDAAMYAVLIIGESCQKLRDIYRGSKNSPLFSNKFFLQCEHMRPKIGHSNHLTDEKDMLDAIFELDIDTAQKDLTIENLTSPSSSSMGVFSHRKTASQRNGKEKGKEKIELAGPSQMPSSTLSAKPSSKKGMG